MERVNHILAHPRFQAELSAIEKLEADRIFCGHDLRHLLDVARLMWIYNDTLEEPYAKELIYAAALCHDIGRAEQYRSGTPHAQAGALIAQQILTDCGYSAQEIKEITEAILGHSGKGSSTSALGRLLYRADKKSRPCFACPAAAECNWPMEKRNLTLEN